MTLRTLTGVAVGLLACASSAFGAETRHYEGCVSSYQSGQPQMVVCTFESPYSCNMIRLYGGSRVVSTSGSSASLARGEFVSVDAMMQSGQPVATVVRVYPNRIVRTVSGFKASQAQSVQSGLNRVPGVRSVRLNSSLGEVLITY